MLDLLDKALYMADRACDKVAKLFVPHKSSDSQVVACTKHVVSTMMLTRFEEVYAQTSSDRRRYRSLMTSSANAPWRHYATPSNLEDDACSDANALSARINMRIVEHTDSGLSTALLDIARMNV